MRKLIILSILFCATFAQERLAIREPQCPTNEDPFNPTHLAHPSDCKYFLLSLEIADSEQLNLLKF
jgi:hypothetical protein